MRKILAIALAKLTKTAGSVLGKSGSALPGLVAEKIKPNLLDDFAESFKKGVIIVTGTNGKTTTVKIITEILRSQGHEVLTNETGSNFTRGILSSMTQKCNLKGKLDCDFAVIESDEAYSRYIAASLKPNILLVTNIMRDQLDRYGEIDLTADLILEAANSAENVILNADDPPVASIRKKVDANVNTMYFGVAHELRKLLPTDEELLDNDEPDRHAWRHNIPETDLMLSRVEEGYITIEQNKSWEVKTKFEGVHNGVNIAAALLTASTALPDSDVKLLSKAVEDIEPAFGRGEKVQIQDRNVHIALAKNPGGFNQNLRTFLKADTPVVLILINDNYADSRDVSWLWDVDFEQLKITNASIILGGTRAFDMALRLQYADIPVDEVDLSVAKAFENALSAGEDDEDILVFPTYTAMLELRKILRQFDKNIKELQ